LVRKQLRFGRGFRVIPGNRASQAAEMVLAPGDAEGGADKRHRKEKHQIRNRGRGLLRTLNFYVPPAYRSDGNPRSRGKK
jgi:hypothetical protein